MSEIVNPIIVPENWFDEHHHFDMPGENNSIRVPYLSGAEQSLINQKIMEISSSLGSYGMGGAGLLGIGLEGGYWIVVGLWGSNCWTKFNGNIIDNNRDRNFKPCGLDCVKLALEGQTVDGISIANNHFFLQSNDNVLKVGGDPSSRPVFAGGGAQRVLPEDLRNAIFLSPTEYLAV